MVTINDDVISTLVRLIEICKDGETGFHSAARKGRYPELKGVFEEYARQRADFVAELRREVERLGGQAESEDTAYLALRRGDAALNPAPLDKPGRVIAAREKGEDQAMRAYKSALDAPLPEETRQIVQRQCMKVAEARERIRLFEIQNENDNVGSATEGAVD